MAATFPSGELQHLAAFSRTELLQSLAGDGRSRGVTLHFQGFCNLLD